MVGRWLSLSVLLSVLCACEGATNTLVVELQTDLVAGVEFDEIETRVYDRPPGVPANLLAAQVVRTSRMVGNRIAEFELEQGDATIAVQLRARGVLVMERLVTARFDGVDAITVVLTRQCRGIECPGAVDPPERTTCYGGFCVDPACSELNPAACGSASCESDGDCTGPPCTQPVCIRGACVLPAALDACGEGEYCDPILDCVPEPSMVCVDAQPCDLPVECQVGRRFCNGSDDGVCLTVGAFADGAPCTFGNCADGVCTTNAFEALEGVAQPQSIYTDGDLVVLAEQVGFVVFNDSSGVPESFGRIDVDLSDADSIAVSDGTIVVSTRTSGRVRAYTGGPDWSLVYDEAVGSDAELHVATDGDSIAYARESSFETDATIVHDNEGSWDLSETVTITGSSRIFLDGDRLFVVDNSEGLSLYERSGGAWAFSDSTGGGFEDWLVQPMPNAYYAFRLTLFGNQLLVLDRDDPTLDAETDIYALGTYFPATERPIIGVDPLQVLLLQNPGVSTRFEIVELFATYSQSRFGFDPGSLSSATLTRHNAYNIALDEEGALVAVYAALPPL